MFYLLRTRETGSVLCWDTSARLGHFVIVCVRPQNTPQITPKQCRRLSGGRCEHELDWARVMATTTHAAVEVHRHNCEARSTGVPVHGGHGWRFLRTVLEDWCTTPED